MPSVLGASSLYDRAHWAAHIADLKAHRAFTDFKVPWMRDDGELRTLLISGKPNWLMQAD